MSRHVDASSARDTQRLDRGSWPSKTNCTTAGETPYSSFTDTARQTGDLDPAEEKRLAWRQRAHQIVDEFVSDRPARAARPISVKEGTKIREECTNSVGLDDGDRRSSTWSTALGEFTRWYNDYRSAHAVFRDPDGNRIRSPLENAHQPRYGNKYYARLKALERQIIKEYRQPHTVMLTFTGSHRNGSGGWRCPADHLRDVIDSWRPDEGRGVYHALRDALGDKRWEYALVLEHHESGYGHVHVAVFVDGEVSEEDFRPVIDTHLRVCDIAGREAHDYHHDDPQKRPISVNRINPDVDPSDYTGEHDVDDAYADGVGNLGSYLSEYIGSYGTDLFDRSISELSFRAAVWSTGSQMLRFSTGANEMIDRDLDRGDGGDAPQETVVMEPKGDGSGEYKPVVQNPGWSIEGIGRVDADGEDIYEIEREAVDYAEIGGAEHLDPPNPQSAARPRPNLQNGTLPGVADD